MNILNNVKLIIISIILSIIISKLLINKLIKFKIGQPIREEGNSEHLKKAGTPTMGGIAFILTVVILSLLFIDKDFTFIVFMLGMLGFGLIGFIDDYAKVKKNNNLGLTGKQKLILQIILAFIMTFTTKHINPEIEQQVIPIFNLKINLGIFTYPILVFIIVGTVNAVNLTDGLDGLLSLVSIPVFLVFSIISIYFIGYSKDFIFFNTTTSMLAAVFFGALLGFLFFNFNPASVFMGDTGSMAIGGALVSIALSLNIVLYLAIIGSIYMVEALSVIIQVISYKTRKKRVFLMSPIHHHFELKGYSEQKITISFFIISCILSLITILMVM